MNCSSKAADLFKVLCITAATLLSVNACTEVDDNLGKSLVPINQQMTIRIDTLDGKNNIRTYTYKQDSLASSKLGYVYFGTEQSAVFGKRKNSFIVQFLPTTLPYDGGYGLRPIVDSMYLVLPLNTVHGDTTVVQKFDVYAINWNDDTQLPEPIHKDSTYYTFFPVEDYIDLGEKLFWFEHTGQRSVGARLMPYGQAGKDYLDSFVKFAEEDLDKYKDDSLFQVKFKGLYVTPAADLAAATYSSSLEEAYMLLYARNHDTIDVNAIYDTVASSFMFYEEYGNASINLVDFDYTGTPVEAALAKTEAKTPQSVTYVQTMGGVSSKLVFSEEIISQLQNLRSQADKDYSDIMINQAEMYVWLEDVVNNPNDYMYLNECMKRIGSYLNLNTYSSIPDYLYYYEYSYQQSDASYQLPYGGYLNRSNGYYKLDITSYVQQLAKVVADGEEPAIAPEFYMGPDAYGYYGSGESVLWGWGDDNADYGDLLKQIKIRLTYTLIDDRD